MIRMNLIEEISKMESGDVIKMYGLACVIADTGEKVIYKSLSSDKAAVEALMKKCIDGKVTIVSLEDIIYDFISEE